MAHLLRQRRDLLLLALLVEGGLAVLAVVLGWLMGTPLEEMLEWTISAVALGTAVSIPMLICFMICVRWPIGPLARIKQFSDEVVRPLFGQCSLVELALISILAGLGEEAFFRGVLQTFFADWLGQWPGLLLASVLFGLLHLITLTYAILAALVGIYLGMIWLADGNLLTIIIAHALYDFVALVYLTHWSK